MRIPAVFVSPYIGKGTVFRSSNKIQDGENLETPYDHTSILATLRDWLNIKAEIMLPSKRIVVAPIFDDILTLATPRDMPAVPRPALRAGEK